jgi:hypothetical protein
MARFTIEATRRSGLSSCEFDVQPIEGEISAGEIIAFVEGGTRYENLILAVLPYRKKRDGVCLVCLNWALPEIMNGRICESRPMNSDEKKRYKRTIHAE